MFWWGNGVKNTKELSEFLLKKLHDETFWKKHFHQYEKNSKELIAAAEKIIFSKALQGTYDIAHEIEIYKKLCMTFHSFIALSWDIEAVDIYFENELKALLQKDCPLLGNKELEKNMQLVITPIQPSFVTQAEMDIYRATLGKLSTSYLEKKYYWLDLSWEGGSLRNKQWFQEAVDQKKKTKDPQKEFHQIEEEFAEKKHEKEEFLKKQQLSAGTKKLIELIGHYCLLHDVRKECQMKVAYALYVILEHLEKKNHFPLTSLQWLSPEETQQVIKEKTMDDRIKEIIAERKKAYLILSLQNFAVVEGQEAIEQRKTLLKPHTQLQNISGMAASPGKTQGTVKVAQGSKEALAKTKEGDVLVMGMTLPECVPAMKKAVAIVTDEGGVTCHAAVISREFGIPCIVGTRIATKILKDGMKVEVNANHGVVTILSKESEEKT
ncbi:hypothetical protein HYW21_05285 [Candidatus Woesearchaeota archaeon]|nr:hypothetical protein [Candidatus Woesearchaeota archaeon]